LRYAGRRFIVASTSSVRKMSNIDEAAGVGSEEERRMELNGYDEVEEVSEGEEFLYVGSGGVPELLNQNLCFANRCGDFMVGERHWRGGKATGGRCRS
jgi:hypothetical protein